MSSRKNIKNDQLRLSTPCVTTLGNIIQWWVKFARPNSTLEKQDVGFNQLPDFNLQRETVLDVMVGCSLVEGTWEVRLIPNRQHIRHPRRRSGLDKVLLEQNGKQLRICHWDWVKLHLWSLFSRLLLMLAFRSLLELQLILRSYQWSHQGTQPLKLALECCYLFTNAREFLVQTYMLFLFVCTSVVGASWLWTRTVRPLLKRIDLLLRKTRCETQTWNYECKMMHDVYVKNGHILKDLSKYL